MRTGIVLVFLVKIRRFHGIVDFYRLLCGSTPTIASNNDNSIAMIGLNMLSVSWNHPSDITSFLTTVFTPSPFKAYLAAIASAIHDGQSSASPAPAAPNSAHATLWQGNWSFPIRTLTGCYRPTYAHPISWIQPARPRVWRGCVSMIFTTLMRASGSWLEVH
jgi:hypothetical protein